MKKNRSSSRDPWLDPFTLRGIARVIVSGFVAGLLLGLLYEIACHIWHFT